MGMRPAILVLLNLALPVHLSVCTCMADERANSPAETIKALQLARQVVESAHGRMVEAIQQRGLLPPTLLPDGGIEQIPYVVRPLEPNWDAARAPLFYVRGGDLPDPFRSISRRDGMKQSNWRALFDSSGFPKGAKLPRLPGEFTVLHLAAQSGNDSVIEMLIRDHPLSVDDVAANGDTALHTACMVGAWSSAEQLISADSKRKTLNIRNVLRLTPLGVTVVANRPAGVPILARMGVTMIQCEGAKNDVAWRDSCEILLAARRGHRECVESLTNHFSPSENIRQEAAELLRSQRRSAK